MQDPIFEQTGRTSRGRDGCRVPIPWSGDRSPFGFSPPQAAQGPWLPQPASWAAFSVAAQRDVPSSTLELYKRALQIRRSETGLGDGPMNWIEAAEGALVFGRGPRFVCMVNVSAEPLPLPVGAVVLLASETLAAGAPLPADAAVWLRVAD
jgi:alpha-glucosidase